MDLATVAMPQDAFAVDPLLWCVPRSIGGRSRIELRQVAAAYAAGEQAAETADARAQRAAEVALPLLEVHGLAVVERGVELLHQGADLLGVGAGAKVDDAVSDPRQRLARSGLQVMAGMTLERGGPGGRCRRVLGGRCAVVDTRGLWRKSRQQRPRLGLR